MNDALDQLKEGDPRKAKIVELRYFGGLSVEETATGSECVGGDGDQGLASGARVAARGDREGLGRYLRDLLGHAAICPHKDAGKRSCS